MLIKNNRVYLAGMSAKLPLTDNTADPEKLALKFPDSLFPLFFVMVTNPLLAK